MAELKITLKRSVIGRPQNQRATVKIYRFVIEDCLRRCQTYETS